MLNRKYHIIFFGHTISFDYYRIGGVESLYRRIAHSLIREGQKISFVFYGTDNNKTKKTSEGIILKYFRYFKDSLQYLSGADFVFDNYIGLKQKIFYQLFRITNKNKIKFGRLFPCIPADFLRQFLLAVQNTVLPYDAPIICLSNNIGAFKKCFVSFKTVSPPIPDCFYLLPQEKRKMKVQDSLQLSFIGRIDNNKGIFEAIRLMSLLIERTDVKCNVYGYLGHDTHSTKFAHNWLLSQNHINYEHQEWKGWDHHLDEYIANICRQTDILILPYQNLIGTMEPPLLLFEGMASSCAILTTNLPSVIFTYGKSPFIRTKYDFVNTAYDIISQILNNPEILYKEQQRVYKRIQSMTSNTDCFFKQILSDTRG